MNELAQAASHFVSQNFDYILGGLGLLGGSAIMSMPEQPPPGFKWMGAENWTWIRDTLQTAIPVKRPMNHNPIPTNPAPTPGK